MNYIRVCASFFVAAMLLSACNTIEGVGEDIRAGGDKIDRTAEKNKTY